MGRIDLLAGGEGNGAVKTYIIRAGKSEFVKIGRAMHPESRCRELQTAHYETLHIIRTIKGDAEKAFHLRFASLRVRGEWFRFDSVMLSFSPPAAEIDSADFEDVVAAYRRAMSQEEVVA